MQLVQPDGSAAPVEVTPPTTLRALLEGADVRAFDFDYLVLDGTTTQPLTRAQALDDVAVAEDADGLRIGEVAAVRAIRLGEGSPLTVTGRADDTTVRAGDEVRFSATVAGLREGQTPRVRWTFPGGERRTGTRVRHTFAKAGRYVVAVGVTTAGDRAGSFDTIVVQVGEAPATHPSPTPTPAAAATAPPAVGTGGGGGSATGRGSGPPKAPATTTPAPTPTPAATAGPKGTLVTGRLLGDRSPGEGAPQQPAVAPAREPGGDLTVPPGVIGAAAVALLAAGGFRLDMRRARPGWR